MSFDSEKDEDPWSSSQTSRGPVSALTLQDATSRVEQNSNQGPIGSLAPHDRSSRVVQPGSQDSVSPSTPQDTAQLPNNGFARTKEQKYRTEKGNTESLALADPSSFPDGGWEAWLVVAGGFCSVFCSFGWINCIGVFQDYYQFHQLKSYSPSTIAWIPSMESFMLFFWGVVAGKIVDNYGPKWPLFVGSVMHVFGLMMTSISTKYYQIFLSQSVCSAIGTSFLFYPSISVIPTWFLKRRALALGIMVCGSSLGGIVLPIMVNRLVVTVGFGWAMRTVAFLILALLVVANLTIKSRLPPKPSPVNLMEFVKPFTEAPFLLLAIGSFLTYFGAFLPFTYIIVQAKAEGMSDRLAGYLVPIVNAASIFGRLVPGYLADKYGVFNAFIISTTLAGILNLALWVPAHSNAPIIVFAALYGFASGTTLSIIPALVAKISDIHRLGIRNGMLYALSAVGTLTGSPIGGAIVARQHGGFSGLKIFSGVTLLAGVVFVVFSRATQVGFAVKIKV